MVLPYNYFLSLGFPTRFDTNRAVRPQKMDRGLKIQIQEVEGLYYMAIKLFNCSFIHKNLFVGRFFQPRVIAPIKTSVSQSYCGILSSIAVQPRGSNKYA